MRMWTKGAIRTLPILAMLLCGHAVVADELTGILQVEITGLKEATGNVYISVYDSDSDWLSDETVLTKKLVIAEALDGDVVRTELQLPMGEYALFAFHDRDSDNELSTNLVGMAKEPRAFSNYALVKFGAPKFADAMFDLGAEPIIQRMSMQEP